MWAARRDRRIRSVVYVPERLLDRETPYYSLSRCNTLTRRPIHDIVAPSLNHVGLIRPLLTVKHTAINQQHQYPYNLIAFRKQLYVQLSVKPLPMKSMKGVNKGSWAPAPIVALTIVPILVLALVTYVAIKCTTWAPALRVKIKAWGIRAWATRRLTLGHKRKVSESTGEDLQG